MFVHFHCPKSDIPHYSVRKRIWLFERYFKTCFIHMLPQQCSEMVCKMLGRMEYLTFLFFLYTRRTLRITVSFFLLGYIFYTTLSQNHKHKRMYNRILLRYQTSNEYTRLYSTKTALNVLWYWVVLAKRPKLIQDGGNVHMVGHQMLMAEWKGN